MFEEKDIYRVLGLQFIEPELRENRGEIEAAAENKLPRLVELMNLRGTFHNHTTESDGHDTLEGMVEEAMELGLQYLGISDHSKACDNARTSNRQAASQTRWLRGGSRACDRLRGSDADSDRTEFKPDAFRHGLALVETGA